MIDAGQPVWTAIFKGSGMTLVRADYPPGLRQPRHWHEYTSVTLLLDGCVEERVGSRVESGGGMSVVVKQAGVEHACRWGTRVARTLSVELDPAFLDASPGGAGGIQPWAWVDREEASRAVIRMYRALRAGHLQEDADDLLLSLLAAIAPREEAGTTTAPPWLLGAIEELRDLGSPRPPTRALADRAGVHPVHFARVFSRHVGCAPTEYVRWLRVRGAAAAIVADPAVDIGRIPYRCGYYDHAHLCRELKRSLELTPTLLRSLARPVVRKN